MCIFGKSKERGYNLIPLKMYFKEGRAKVEISIAKGKKLHDKRATIKRREAEREMNKAMKLEKKN